MRMFEEPHCFQMIIGDKEYKVYDGSEAKLYFEEIQEESDNN